MSQVEPKRTRVRLEEIVHETTRDGRCAFTVRLEWSGGRHEASARNLDTLQGRLQGVAHATLSAATEVGAGAVTMERVGVKSVRAFDGWVVVARLDGSAAGRRYRLLGSASCEEEEALHRATAQAVLSALNRVLEPFVT